MHCSSCGTALTEGLSYCKRCGAEAFGKDRTVPLKPDPIPEFLVWAIVGVSVGGLAILGGLIAVMKWATFRLRADCIVLNAQFPASSRSRERFHLANAALEKCC